jgi:hypothetical protein
MLQVMFKKIVDHFAVKSSENPDDPQCSTFSDNTDILLPSGEM